MAGGGGGEAGFRLPPITHPRRCYEFGRDPAKPCNKSMNPDKVRTRRTETKTNKKNKQ